MIRAGACRAISRCALLPGVCFLLVLGTVGRSSQALPSYQDALFAARLSLAAAACLSLVWLPVSLLDSYLRRGWAALACALAQLAVLPGACAVARHLALSDGLRARGVPAAFAQPFFTGLLSLVAVALWCFQRYARFRPLDVSLGLLLLGLLFGVDVWAGRTQVDLSALLHAFGALLLAALLYLALERFPVGLERVSLASCSLVIGLVALSWLQPSAFARGRRHALAQESALELIERELLLAPAPARMPPRPSSARCAQLVQRASIPQLGLEPERRRNVVLISIDALRADYVGARIHGRQVMPSAMRFMQESRRAALTHTSYPATLLALSSAFRGLTVSELLLAPGLPPSLFELLHPRLESVRAVLPSGRYFKRPDVIRYLLRGAEVSTANGAPSQTSRAIAALRGLRAAGKQHLLWIHYFEPHAPYLAWPGLDFGSSDRERYLSELAVVDRALGRLLNVLRSEGWYEDSLIALFADHGESFGERGHRYHHNVLYPWLTRVPFALHVPHAAPGTIHGPVQLADLTPTVLQFLGTPEQPYPMSARALLTSDPSQDRVLVSEELAIGGAMLEHYASHPPRSARDIAARVARIERGPGYPSKLAVMRAGLQLITHRGSGVIELYDVRADPRAAHDLADAATPARSALQREAALLRERTLQQALCQLQEPH